MPPKKGYKQTKHHIERKRKALLGHSVSDETKEKISKKLTGRKQSKEHILKATKHMFGNKYGEVHRKYAESWLKTEHLKHKKQECLFGCENAKIYDLHHEPKMTSENYKEWEGRLINLCRSCHRKVHCKTLKFSINEGIKWTLKDTKKRLTLGKQDLRTKTIS